MAKNLICQHQLLLIKSSHLIAFNPQHQNVKSQHQIKNAKNGVNFSEALEYKLEKVKPSSDGEKNSPSDDGFGILITISRASRKLPQFLAFLIWCWDLKSDVDI